MGQRCEVHIMSSLFGLSFGELIHKAYGVAFQP
jgi:hypothetical protein